MQIIYKKIDELIPYENNPRHNDQAVDAVAASIKEFGFRNPIIIDKNNVIVAGHTRQKAAKQLGLTEVPCVMADDLTDEQIRAFRIADNKTTEIAEWNFDLLRDELAALEDMFTGFDSQEIDDLLAEALEPLEDDYEIEPPAEPRAKLGDMEFEQFLKDAFTAMGDALKPGGVFYIWHANTTVYEFERALKAAGLQSRQQLIWNKDSIVLSRQDYHWKHESCLYGWKGGAGHYFIDDRKQRTVIEDYVPNYRSMKKEDMVRLLDELYADKISSTVINERRPSTSQEHPTMKPIKLLARLIQNSSRANEGVLDLFGGSGSTLIACEQLNRKCYMMELDPAYIDVIIDRWETYTGQEAVKL